MPQMGKGCNVIEDEELRNQCKDMFKGKHSWRGYKDTDFKELWNACKEDAVNSEEKLDCGITIRRGLQGMEDGRFDSMMEAAHKFFIPLDQDEREDFADRHPEMVKRIDEWAAVQEMRQIENSSPEIMKQINKARRK